MSKKIVAAFMTVLMMIAVIFMSSTVAFAKTALSITKQPASVKVLSGQEAKVTVKAKGDGLTYKWYYKNKGDKKYTISKTVKKSTYTVKMKESADGRKVYCVVTDKYGSSVKSKAVTLSKGTAVKVTKKPSSVSADCGSEAKVKVTAKGDGLTYKWYYKNKGDKKYTLSKSVKKSTYTVKMKSSADGRRVYCVITDAYGKSVKTDSVKLTLKHVYDSGKVTQKATCKSTGIKVYTCKECSKTKSETLSKTDHSYAGWKTYTEATVTSKGVERNKCKNCTYYKDRSTDMLKAVTYITLNTGVGKAEKVGVASNGKYSLKAPVKVGYNFTGWKDSSGNDFPASGTYKNNITVTAQWELDGTNTLSELVERTDAGVSEIKITGNITVNNPVFIYSETKIYADADYTIKRDPSYKGDIFVVGRDRNGTMASTVQKKAVLNIGGGKGTLTVDGNRDNLKTTVVGSALFIADSSEVNIYDGVKIVNNKKTGNERALTYSKDVTGSIVEKAGGAAMLVLNSTVNIYGGVFDNNIVDTEYTITTNEAGANVYNETNGCGGAIFNLGNINMYGGTISNNEALRGGGIYSGRIMYLFAGEISGNTGYAYGGGLSTSSSADADTFIGSVDGANEMIFDNNSSKTGGAVYSNTSSPVIILGKARFTNNSSSSGGGAIYTAGPLTVRGSVFEENSAIGSGGAIYHHYTKESFERRLFELTDCVLENNSASLGGAVALSASDAVAEKNQGTYATITGCAFNNNKAVKTESNVGNGGAMYVTRKSEAIVSKCTFAGNTAVNNAGAVSVQSASKTQLTDCSFTSNQSISGGAVYAATDTTLTMKNIQFKDNKAVTKESGSEGNGGALYIYDAKVTFNNVDFEGNSAANHAGATYICASDISIDSSCSFVGNSAKNHGGAFYLTYKTNSDSTKDGAVLNATGVNFKNNTAMAGGAISARTDCTANLTNAILKGNSVEGFANKADGDGEGGGAIYVGYGTLSLTNVTATGNTASDFGGVVDAAGAEVTVNGGTFTENKSNNGGMLYACANSEVTVTNTVVSKNESVYANTEYNNAIGGGAISTKSGKLSVSGVTFDGNKSAYYGGAVHTNKTDVTINGNTSFVNSQGGTGAALFFIGSAEVKLENISVNNNNATSNGVVYASGGTITMNNIAATGNKAANGGILYTSGSSTQVNITNNIWKGNSASTGGIAYIANATVNVTDCTFEENTAYLGGVAYVKLGTLNTSNVKFIKNSAVRRESGSAGNGGAVSLDGGIFNTSTSDIFTENTAENHGGAVYVSYYTNEKDGSKTGGSLIADGGIFSKNTAMGGGAISIRTNGTAVLTGTTLSENRVTGYADKNDGDGEGGGAVYVGYGDLTLNNATVNGNTAESAGGAINALRSSLTVEGGTYTANKSTHSGGALFIYASNNEECFAKVKNAVFNSNEAGNGGAVYAYRIPSTDFASLKFEANKANSHGGAIYLSSTELTVDSATEFKNNSAGGHGGAAYLTYYTNSDNVKIGAVLNANETKFEGNTAMAGGAISARTNCTANLDGASFISNTVEGYADKNDGDGEGGGAFYVGFGTLNLNNVTATGNEAKASSFINDKGEERLYGYGGFIDGYNAVVNIIGGTISGNKAPSGGAINISGSGNTLTVNGTRFTGNESVFVQPSNDYDSTKGGGAVNITGATVTINNVTFDGNSTKWYGGAILASGSQITVDKSSFINSTGATGAALNFKSCGTVTLTDTEINNNTSSYNGVLYANACTVTMNSVTASGNKAYNGGLIYTSGASTVFDMNNCNFTGNSATNGGVAFVENATLKFNGGTITGNNATNGGVVYAKEGSAKVKFSSCEASENSAKSGGVIYSKTGSFIDIKDTVFEENNATANGGVIYTEEAAEFTVNDSEFNKNFSKSNGGAIYVYRTPVTLVDSSFTENSTNAHGGAINNIGSVITATGDNTFTSNSAVNHGGAIYVTYISKKAATETEPAIEAAVGVINFTGGTFTGNSAKGGGAFSVRTGCVANLTDTVLTGNTVEGYADKNDGDGEGGGAVYVGFGTLNLNNVTATGNEAKASLYVNDKNEEKYYGFGGFIDGYKAAVNIIGGTISGNKAPSGGAINISGSGNTLTVSGTSFADNEASYINDEHDSTKGGGAIYFKGGDLNISGATFDANKSGFYGGAVMANAATVKIDTNTAFTNNTSATGAALYFVNSTTATVENTALTNNTAVSNGGAVYANGSTVDFTNVTATGNKATNGGVLYTSGANTVIEIKDSLWSNNSATMGGTMHITDATVKVNGCEFKENSAQIGGAIYNSRGIVTLSGNEFTANTAIANASGANGNGAAISLSGGTATADGTNKFSGNTAVGHGGAIYVAYANNTDGTKTPGVLTMGADVLETNSASSGGAISSRTECQVYLTGTELKGNTAISANTSEGGGAIFTNNNILSLSGVIIDGNTTGYYGGAVTALSANVIVKDNSIIKNNTGTTGVTFNFRDSCNVTFTDVSVTDNVSTVGSGVIYATGSSKLNITNLTAKGNKNNNGGVIYSSGSANINITSSTFENNTAVSYGGVIDHRSSKKLIVTDSTFKGNSAGISGGAIHAFGEVETTNCIFENNSANAEKKSDTISRGGGAIFVRSGKTVKVNGGSFISNSAAGTSDAETMTDAGGAILVDGGNLTVTNAAFNTNTANNGGALGTSKAKETVMNITGCTFTENTSTKNGGGVYVQNGVISDTDTIVIMDCTFNDNTASTASGSAVYIRTASSAKVINIKASGGKVSWKGTVYATSGARVTLEGSVNLGTGEEVYVTGSGTSAVVNYKTDAEKNAWSDAITTASSATVTYVNKA